MSTFKERLQIEFTELELKLSKLEAFLATEAFVELANVDKILLEKQFSIMTDYSRILNTRLKRLEQDKFEGADWI